jgi:deoxyhypusine synthase
VPDPNGLLFPVGLKTYSLSARKSKIDLAAFARRTGRADTVRRFIDNLPDVLAARDFRDLAARLQAARRRRATILWAMGAHVIKVGLNPVLIGLMKDGWVSGLALNGAGIIHDFELAYCGRTSEDVAAGIKTGRFGMARETGELLNAAIRRGAEDGLGLGESIGRMIATSRFPHKKTSLLAAAYRQGIPATVHVALGTDIIHAHPSASGEAIGATSLRDFHRFAALVARLENGVFLNIGSAVVLPEVFLKAVALARNRGTKLGDFTTAVFDFQRQYRPAENVVRRPLGKKSRGFYLVGPHEIMIPLLAAALG